MPSSIPSGVASVKLVSANQRSGLVITNTDANRLYVLLGEGVASAANYSFHLDTGDTWFSDGSYDGAAQGIWAADGAGAALVTEY